MSNMIYEVVKRLLPENLLEEPFSLFATRPSALESLRDSCKGKRCFIVGNGPSLNKMDLSKLSDEYSFAVNGIFYKTEECGYRPTFYVVEDRHVILDNVDEIKKFQPAPGGFRFFPARYRFKIGAGDNTFFLNFNRGFYDPRSSFYETPRFSTDASRRVYCGQSVTIVNIQIAYWLGFSEVYLIGMDFSYNIPDSAKVDGNVLESTEDDINHFHPDYFGAGKKWHDPKLHNVLKSYMMCKFMFELDGRKIFNATAGGNLNVFERADYDGLFGS
ncbi:6-hydroxymethylpterin diphosphokinase MptE-like protein [Sphingobium sp. Ndbn-10]|uniref:6-hydroxymethylpterin diphosphokinase MptE-like protein n=1 Tax=Sphingobium sp. Ndbn-10 TaxID=1667223 RepID=UPI0009F2FEF7|nr:6-hydroxymethylpterin diphosphokinase MptE-like protein [Sphingobium sp. Ndbn-10]